MSYQEIKELKKQGHNAKDLIVLAAANDPFYMGQPAQEIRAKWFSDLWERFGYDRGVHLRRVHYQIVSQNEPVLMPNTMPYENTKGCWKFLTDAGKCARYLGYVDPYVFDDRRNGEPVIYDLDPDFDGDARIDIEYDLYFPGLGSSFPSLPEIPDYQTYGFDVQQRYHVEIWAEKSTMNDVLKPLCDRYNVNLITGLGELSITQVCWLMQRIQERSQKPCRILYVSDFDPAGVSMPVAVSRKIEYFVHDRGDDFDIRLFPMILTQEQCTKYQLPRTPIKESERRAGAFEERFGKGATEMDALEALYPGELERILTEAIKRYRDDDLDHRVDQYRDEMEEHLESVRQTVIELHQEEIEEINDRYQGLKDRYEAAVADIEAEMNELYQEMENVWHGIKDEMEQEQPIDFELPEPDMADEINHGLYDSNREYMEQLTYST